MLDFPAGGHPAPKAGLQFVLAAPLCLPRGSCLFLHGDNGVGKTTFLEEVFIPKIRTAHTLLYLAQDMELQQNTIRATLALLDLPVPDLLPDMVRAWMLASPSRDVIILDEFDKYWGPDTYAHCGLAEFSWAVTVSHLDLTAPYRAFARGYRLHLVRTAPATVSLTLENLW